VATALDMLAALEAHLDVLRRGLLDAARHLTGAKVLAERQYGVGPATALAMTCWLSGTGRFSSSRKAARFAGLDVTVWSSDRKPHAQSLEDVEAALTATLAAVGLPLAAVATTVLACRLVSFWAVVAGGWVVFFFLRRSDRLSRQAQDGLPSAGPEPQRGLSPEQGGDRP
jgi:transposase